MFLKEGVDERGVVPELWYYLGRLDELHKVWTGLDLVVTDLRREVCPWPSSHVPNSEGEVLAADLRRWFLDAQALSQVFARYVQTCHRSILEVVLEPEWLSPAQIAQRGGYDHVAPHIHVELVERRFPRSG